MRIWGEVLGKWGGDRRKAWWFAKAEVPRQVNASLRPDYGAINLSIRSEADH